MDILYLLIPLSVLLVLALVAVLAWALQSGQFDDLEHQGELIFEADEAERRAEALRAEARGAEADPGATVTKHPGSS